MKEYRVFEVFHISFLSFLIFHKTCLLSLHFLHFLGFILHLVMANMNVFEFSGNDILQKRVKLGEDLKKTLYHCGKTTVSHNLAVELRPHKKVLNTLLFFVRVIVQSLRLFFTLKLEIGKHSENKFFQLY